jgi:hypothetical protein
MPPIPPGAALRQPKSLASLYSITLSVSAGSCGGSSSPSTFAVVRLITSSNFVGCSTGKSEADFKTAAVLQWLGDGGDDAWRDERAADPLHCPRIDAKPSSDFALTGPSGSLQCLMDSFFQGAGYRTPPEAFSRIPAARGRLGRRHRRRFSSVSPRFRTIQVCPKDLRVLRPQPKMR